MLEARLLAGICTLLLASCAGPARAEEATVKAASPSVTIDSVSDLIGVLVIPSPTGFSFRSGPDRITAESPDERAVDEYLPLLATELDEYPRALIRCLGLTKIVLCGELTCGGQPRLGVASYADKSLYLNVNATGYFARRVLHHEFFHLIDWFDDIQVYQGEQWAALNPPGFEYGDGGESAQDDPTASILTDQYEGFLNRYSMTGIEEDKAEVFSCLMVDRAFVMQRAGVDMYLQEKLREMEWLLDRFCDDIDEEFLERIGGPY